MDIKKIDHIGIAVNNIEKTVKVYTQVLGIKPEDVKYSEVPGRVKIAFIPVGKDTLELLEFFDKKAQPETDTLHHIAVEVKDINGSLKNLKAQGVPLDDEQPKPGPAGNKIAFINPKKTGVTIELVEN